MTTIAQRTQGKMQGSYTKLQSIILPLEGRLFQVKDIYLSSKPSLKITKQNVTNKEADSNSIIKIYSIPKKGSESGKGWKTDGKYRKQIAR